MTIIGRYIVGLGSNALTFKNNLKDLRLVDRETGEVLIDRSSKILMDYLYNTSITYITSAVVDCIGSSISRLIDLMPEFEEELSQVVIDEDIPKLIDLLMEFGITVITNIFKAVILYEKGYILLDAYSHDYIVISQYLE